MTMVYIIEGELQFSEENKIASKGQMVYFDQSSDEDKFNFYIKEWLLILY